MKNILLDTNAYVAFKRGVQGAVDIVRLSEQIGVSIIVMGELLAGFVSGGQENRNRKEFSEFLSSPRVRIFPADDETVEYYARIFRQLKNKGKPIPTNDLWIAATAMQHGFAVFTYDNHFSNIDNLLVCRSPETILP